MKTISEIGQQLGDKPQFVFRPQALRRAAQCFLKQFQGKSLFAVKTNPDAAILQALYAQGLREFDVASIAEIKQVSALFPDATLYFMHPIKSREAIRSAYFDYGVRHFSLDTEQELHKILHETGQATDLNLHVRLAMPNNFAELALAEKFGVNLQEAPALIAKVATHAAAFGTCFHVGSQCMHPDAYRIAIRMANEVIRQSGVRPDFFNVGGGFPSIYPGMNPPQMQSFFDATHDEFRRVEGHEQMQLLAEPGRALVAESMSLLVRVEMRKGHHLYINEGTYGSLFDAGIPQFIFPVKLICDEKIVSTDLHPFSFYGPTCDSLDVMKGPFYLPSDTEEGDIIEIGQMGAYGRTMATGFNGFTSAAEILEVSDSPLMTLYGDSEEALEIIAA